MEISILMVDDDRILVEKLEETVDWKRIGISMVFTANNILSGSENFRGISNSNLTLRY